MILRILTSIILFFLFFQIAHGNQRNKVFGYAESRLHAHDYYRAHVEYQREAFKLPKSKLKEFGQMRSLEVLFLAGQFDQLNHSLIGDVPPTPRMAWLRSFSYMKQGNTKKANQLLKEFCIKVVCSESDLGALSYQSYLWQLEFDLSQELSKPTELEKIDSSITLPDYLEFNPEREVALKQWSKWSTTWPIEDYKSEMTSAILSTILPGAGYAYNNEWGNAVSSFTIVSMFTGLTILALSQHETGLGIISASLGGLFYGSSIYGSYYSSKRYNNTLKKNYSKQLDLFSLKYKMMKF